MRFPGLEEADDRLAYVYATLAGARRLLREAGAAAPAAPPGRPGALLQAFCEHMRNDFNTGGALGTLSRPLAEINALLALGQGRGQGGAAGAPCRPSWPTWSRWRPSWAASAPMPEAWLRGRRDRRAARAGLDLARVEALLTARREARAAKDWARADAIRDELAALGLTVKDGPDGSVWDFA